MPERAAHALFYSSPACAKVSPGGRVVSAQFDNEVAIVTGTAWTVDGGHAAG